MLYFSNQKKQINMFDAFLEGYLMGKKKSAYKPHNKEVF